MRLRHRNNHGQRGKLRRIAISQAEITADLHYPASRSSPGLSADVGARRTDSR